MPAADSGPLVEFTVHPDGGLQSGLRVFPDGRAESLESDGGWRDRWRYEAAKLEQLRRAIADADSPPLEARYERPGGVSHPTTVVWRLRHDGETKTVTVEKYTPGLVPALDRLFTRIYELRPEPEASSTWRVRVGGRLVERTLNCEPAFAPQLAPLVKALFARDEGGGSNGAGPSGPSEPLVEITWRTNREVTERTIVYANGRNVSVREGKEHDEKPYSKAEVAAIEAAIGATGWASLPDPVC